MNRRMHIAALVEAARACLAFSTILDDITILSHRHPGVAIGIDSDQRDELKHALTNIGGGELAGPLPPVPSKYNGPVVLLHAGEDDDADGSTIEVTDAEVLGILGGTTIVSLVPAHG